MASLIRKMRTSRLAWHIKNVPARFAYRRNRSKLTSAEQAVLDNLKKDGIAITHMRDLFVPEVFKELLDEVSQRRARPEVQERLSSGAAREGEEGKKASFLVDLWEKEHVVHPENPFMRYSLSRQVLGIVDGYLGLCGRFRDFFLQITVPLTGEAPIASQRWHADPDDYRLVKVFLYLNDVDEEAGPFTYIKGSHGRGRHRYLFPYAPKTKSRHPDPAFIDHVVPKEDIVVATGGAGTIIFCDTSGIHRGGHAKSKERVMYTSVFTTPGGFLPTRLTIPNGLGVQHLGSLLAIEALRRR